jgi:hypothetical protein
LSFYGESKNESEDEAFPEIQFISEVPDYTIHKDKGCSYQSSDYRVPEDEIEFEYENENEKDIKRKARSCRYNPKDTNQGD